MTSEISRLLFIYHHAPHAQNAEDLALLLAASAFPMEVQVIFMRAGIAHLIGTGDRIAQLRALPHYGIEQLYVDEESLRTQKISTDQLSIPAKMISRDTVHQYCANASWVIHR